MSYPELPNNRLIVNGVDLTERFSMILSDGYVLGPPEPKTYTVDIPGGDGVLDLTETLLGDTAYKNRNMEFEFYVISVDRFEEVKTNISNFLHGKSYDFQMTMDPGYTYHGRFSVSSYTHSAYNLGIVGVIKIKIDGNPYKYQPNRTYKVDAVGGKTVYFESGRKRVRPRIETDSALKVIFNNTLFRLPQGTWMVNDILFKAGVNEVYFNSYDVKNLTWGDLKTSGVTFGEFKNKKLYEWYTSKDDGTSVIAQWDDLSNTTWAELSEKTWGDLTYTPEKITSVKDVYVEYKVGDL